MIMVLTILAIGVGIGYASALAYNDMMRIRSNERLRKENTYLKDEVGRLRAQVALHINSATIYAPNVDSDRVGQCQVAA